MGRRKVGRPKGKCTQGQRLVKLYRLLAGGAVHTVAALAAELDVHERSVRRDLIALRGAGVDVRLWQGDARVVEEACRG